MKKKQLVILFILVFLLISIGLYYYILHAGQRNINNEKASFEVTSKIIYQEYFRNVDSANAKYIDKAVVIKGIVTSIKNHELIIDNTIICNLKNIDNAVKVDQNVTVKGRVVGYDDLMSELKLDNCFINK